MRIKIDRKELGETLEIFPEIFQERYFWSYPMIVVHGMLADTQLEAILRETGSAYNNCYLITDEDRDNYIYRDIESWPTP